MFIPNYTTPSPLWQEKPSKTAPDTFLQTAIYSVGKFENLVPGTIGGIFNRKVEEVEKVEEEIRVFRFSYSTYFT
jgi:hypothetical protein